MKTCIAVSCWANALGGVREETLGQRQQTIKGCARISHMREGLKALSLAAPSLVTNSGARTP
ncbi:MAG TPA: hypothetical protein VE986_09700, partial [Hyphomicrobiales bacterium]|nr:hypothetical protein [Hyphomicrobiales bacterium]